MGIFTCGRRWKLSFFVLILGIFSNTLEKYKILSTFVKVYNLQNKENVVIYTYRNG